MLGERERKTERETLGEENIQYIADGSELGCGGGAQYILFSANERPIRNKNG